MLFPSILNDSFTDDFFDDFFTPAYWTTGVRGGQAPMSADVKEYKDRYELQMSLPGYSKEDIQAELKDGYLTISAVKREDADKKDEEGRYIRRERYSGKASRSFYVGEDVKEEDIKAAFKDGVLTVAIPKKEQEVVDASHYIEIEG